MLKDVSKRKDTLSVKDRGTKNEERRNMPWREGWGEGRLEQNSDHELTETDW